MSTIRLFVIIIFTLIFFLLVSPTWASEGKIELRSTVGQNARCLVTSVLMEDLNYSLLVNCRDLIYPPDSDNFAYVLWTIPTTGKTVKLGKLGVGKAEFRTNLAFSTLFVTKESSEGVQAPSEMIVMQGVVEPLEFLEIPTTPFPTPVIEKPSPTPPPIATRGEELIAAVRRAALIFLAIVLSLVVFAIAAISTLRRLRS